MKPFLDKIATRLLVKFPDGMEGVAVVLPSKRAVVFLKHYLAQKIKKPVFLPEFYSIEEFVEKLSSLQVLDNISLQFRLYQSYLNNPPQKVDSFDDFLNWSNVLLHDFNDIDRNMVDATAIYSNLKDVKELEGWSVEDWSLSVDELTPMQSDYISFFGAMINWYHDFKEQLKAENVAYQGMAYRQAAECVDSATISWKKVWFVGLNALTKSEQKIINFLKKEDVARVFWDADHFYYDNPMHEAGGFLREQKEQWSEIDFKGVDNYYAKQKESFKVIACPKNITQAKVASEVIRKFSKEDLDNSNTAIVLADEGLLFPVLHNLPSEVKQLNVTMGSPLKGTALFAFVEALFNMQLHAIKYRHKAFYYKDVIAVVEHPYFSKLAEENELSDFKRFITNHNIVFIGKSNIDNFFKSSEIVKSLFILWTTVNQALEALDSLIGALRLPLVGKTGSIESEVLSTFYRCLTSLNNLLSVSSFDIELRTLQVIMQQLVANETIPFKGEPLKGVQLMGILESRTLDFKNVIMLSVNEGKLPKGKSVNSFIPYDMKRYFKLPTYSESDAVFSYHFYRLLQRANNITLVYSSVTDDFGSGEKSRFITQLLSEYKSSEIKEYVYKGEDFEIDEIQPIVVQNKGLESVLKAWATNGVSPSALNRYNNCSLSFYYHYLAKIRVDEQIDEYADSSTLGTAVHNALDKHYPIGVLEESFIKENTGAILSTIRDEFVEVLSEQGMEEGKNYLSLQIAQKLTKDFLALEQKTIREAAAENQQIKVLSKEENLDCEINIDGLEFRLIGKADRVDVKGDVVRIIDYKTGMVTPSELKFQEYDELVDNPKRAKAFQLLMYAYIYMKMNPNCLGKELIVGNYAFKNLKEGLITVTQKAGSSETKVVKITSAVLDEFQDQLEVVLTKIVNDDFEQTSDINSCKWCDYKSICKR